MPNDHTAIAERLEEVARLIAVAMNRGLGRVKFCAGDDAPFASAKAIDALYEPLLTASADEVEQLTVERDEARLERDTWCEDCAEERERSAGLRDDLAEAREKLEEAAQQIWDSIPKWEARDIEARATQAEAELERLNKALKYEQDRSDRIGTHGPGCFTWGHRHYDCALIENARLESELERLRAGSGWRDSIGNFRWNVAMNTMRWRLDDLGDWPLDKVSRCLDAITADHYGDCNNKPITCLRCEAEAAYKQADEILRLFQPEGRERS